MRTHPHLKARFVEKALSRSGPLEKLTATAAKQYTNLVYGPDKNGFFYLLLPGDMKQALAFKREVDSTTLPSIFVNTGGSNLPAVKPLLHI